ncbi:uncharacterized protein N7459_005672 [Penicillium hispanicum]|uniref:uncharacterized protein n=1 Tax=Penicillium hispanicum TaxID=1080232 RepID=UPI002541EBF6|nr:uncharacterized protein N7459_005672 [Penicillium hispanicum]KAJ5579687.1 hypothetical protein N7459_005672 [Penicillium hispanicum]
MEKVSENDPAHQNEDGDSTLKSSMSRKVADCRVLPLLTVAFAVYQLDRTNIASALTGGFAADIAVDQNTINLGNQLMYIGVILLEIPSNLVLYKIGPRSWMSAQVFIFGLVACLQIFVRNKTGFLLTRAILGLTEAGYIPGAMYALSTWYSSAELTSRIAVFFFGMFGGTAVSPLIGAGLLKLDGKGSLAGWQWIFLVEGIGSIMIAIALFSLLPERGDLRSADSPGTSTSDVEKNSFAKESSVIPRNNSLPLSVVWRTLKNFQKWPHFMGTACVFSTWCPLTTYTPSIIMDLGFNRIQANALTAIGSLMTLPVVLAFAWLSDKTNRRGLAVMIAISAYLIALICLRLLEHHVGNWSKFGLWTTVNGLAVGYHPIHNAWIQMNCETAEERSISVAMFVMTATSGLMAGTQIFRSDEAAELYPRGILIMIILVVSGLLFVAVQLFIYSISNKRRLEKGERPNIL